MSEIRSQAKLLLIFNIIAHSFQYKEYLEFYSLVSRNQLVMLFA